MDWVLRRSYSYTRIRHPDPKCKIELDPYHEHNTSKITSDLQVSLSHLLTVGNDNSASLASCGPLVHDPIATLQSLNLPSLLTM